MQNKYFFNLQSLLSSVVTVHDVRVIHLTLLPHSLLDGYPLISYWLQGGGCVSCLLQYSAPSSSPRAGHVTSRPQELSLYVK